MNATIHLNPVGNDVRLYVRAEGGIRERYDLHVLSDDLCRVGSSRYSTHMRTKPTLIMVKRHTRDFDLTARTA